MRNLLRHAEETVEGKIGIWFSQWKGFPRKGGGLIPRGIHSTRGSNIFQRKERLMETAVNEEKELRSSAEGKEKKTFWNRFYNFLAYGGFILVLLAAVAIYITISLLVK
jgi:hypothetical protein